MRLDDDTAQRLRAAFPSALAEVVDVVLRRLPDPIYRPSPDDIGEVTLEGEGVRIPCRVYLPKPSLVHSIGFADRQRTVRSCIYTRHHDGHVREAAVKRLLPPSDAFVLPFVVQLLGEYVIEIVELVARSLGKSPTAALRAFALENPAFLARTRQRAISYWDCYYRSSWPRRADYPALRVIDALASSDA